MKYRWLIILIYKRSLSSSDIHTFVYRCISNRPLSLIREFRHILNHQRIRHITGTVVFRQQDYAEYL